MPGRSARIEVRESITIDRPAEKLSAIVRDPEQLSRITGDFADVSSAGEYRQHWSIHGPMGLNTSFTIDIVEERPEGLLRWESLEGASIPNNGELRFQPAPGDQGTEVTLRLRADPPGGPLGTFLLSRMEVVPDSVAREFLRRFKRLAETGEIASLEYNPSGRGSGDLL